MENLKHKIKNKVIRSYLVLLLNISNVMRVGIKYIYTHLRTWFKEILMKFHMAHHPRYQLEEHFKLHIMNEKRTMMNEIHP